MRLKLIVAAVGLATAATAAEAQDMAVSQFLAKADALEKKGAMALFSGDMRLLKREITQSAKALRAERLAAQRAGRQPAYCPPEKQGSLEVKEILGHFRSIAPARRQRMPVHEGLRGLMATKYPCQ